MFETIQPTGEKGKGGADASENGAHKYLQGSDVDLQAYYTTLASQVRTHPSPHPVFCLCPLLSEAQFSIRQDDWQHSCHVLLGTIIFSQHPLPLLYFTLFLLLFLVALLCLTVSVHRSARLRHMFLDLNLSPLLLLQNYKQLLIKSGAPEKARSSIHNGDSKPPVLFSCCSDWKFWTRTLGMPLFQNIIYDRMPHTNIRLH